MFFIIGCFVFIIMSYGLFYLAGEKNKKTLEIMSDSEKIQPSMTRIKRLQEIERQIEKNKEQSAATGYQIKIDNDNLQGKQINNAEKHEKLLFDKIQKYNFEVNKIKNECERYKQEIKEIIFKHQEERDLLAKLQEEKEKYANELSVMQNRLIHYHTEIENSLSSLACVKSEIKESNDYLNIIMEKIKKGEKLLYSMRVEYRDWAERQKEIEEQEDNLIDLIWEEKKLLETLEKCSKKTAEMDHYFSQSYIAGRKWLSEMIAEKFTAEDETKAKILATQKRPALKAAEELRVSAAEKRELSAKLKFLEYQLKSYQEKFPFLLDFEEEILNETLSSAEQIRQIDEEIRDDRASNYLSREEYMSLPPSSRNQLALDRYLSGSLNKAEIGRMYERYIGYLYEQKGYSVEYHGILKGFEDLGRDLICRKKGEIHIIQAKCWSDKKQIHENHICQLFGTANHFKKSHTGSEKISTFLITSTTLSDTAKDIADALGVSYKEQQKLDKSYPMIKCNISRKTGEKIYHMPFDQVYDKVVIEPDEGEMYAADVFEAEFHGFRRAFKYTGLHN